MTMHKKLQESMRQGVILERDRCMRILFKIAKNTKDGLDRKLMTAGEKHIAELRFKIAEGLVAAAQMMVMSGEDPDAKETKDGPTPPEMLAMDSNSQRPVNHLKAEE